MKNDGGKQWDQEQNFSVYKTMFGKPIPLRMRKEMDEDPYYHKCARKSEGDCSGRITWEHAWIYGSNKIQEKWAIIPLCWWHHLGAGMVKWKNELIALRRATPEDLAKYPKKDWAQELKRLEYVQDQN